MRFPPSPQYLLILSFFFFTTKLKDLQVSPMHRRVKQNVKYKAQICSWFSKLTLEERRNVLLWEDKKGTFLLKQMYNKKWTEGNGFFYTGTTSSPPHSRSSSSLLFCLCETFSNLETLQKVLKVEMLNLISSLSSLSLLEPKSMILPFSNITCSLAAMTRLSHLLRTFASQSSLCWTTISATLRV